MWETSRRRRKEKRGIKVKKQENGEKKNEGINMVKKEEEGNIDKEQGKRVKEWDKGGAKREKASCNSILKSIKKFFFDRVFGEILINTRKMCTMLRLAVSCYAPAQLSVYISVARSFTLDYF